METSVINCPFIVPSISGFCFMFVNYLLVSSSIWPSSINIPCFTTYVYHNSIYRRWYDLFISDNSNPTVEKPSDSQEQQSEDSVDQSEKQDGADAADSDTGATDTTSGEEAELPVEETSESSSSDENKKIELW